MHPEVVEVLVAIGEYPGTQEDFLHGSVVTVQAALQCSREAAERIIHNLMNHGGINLGIMPGEELPLSPMAIPTARWYWYIPPAA